jgi:hypothetical protein
MLFGTALQLKLLIDELFRQKDTFHICAKHYGTFELIKLQKKTVMTLLDGSSAAKPQNVLHDFPLALVSRDGFIKQIIFVRAVVHLVLNYHHANKFAEGGDHKDKRQKHHVLHRCLTEALADYKARFKIPKVFVTSHSSLAEIMKVFYMYHLELSFFCCFLSESDLTPRIAQNTKLDTPEIRQDVVHFKYTVPFVERLYKSVIYKNPYDTKQK